MATTMKADNIKEKLKYLGLDLNRIPKHLQTYEPVEFIALKGYDENQYKQYRYIPIKDIQILLSPTHRLDEIEKKYKKARPLCDYLDNISEKNVVYHTMFLKMLQDVKIEEIQKVEEEQKELNKRIPFKVKYDGNYLWQIYYSEETNKYFMIVPTEDSDYSTFFYLLKRQLETRRAGKIFVPIRNVEYSNNFLRRRQFEDIENYLWSFTSDWPLIYEVYDRLGNMSIQIIGETQVYGKIKSPYRIKLSTREEAIKFYKLLKAMFILQTELAHFFKFETNISKNGGIEFYHEKKLIKYENIPQFINDQYKEATRKEKEASMLIKKYDKMLKELKIEATTLELEYLAKERQISTFLECKKTFFGKVKYYFKYSKKKSAKNKQEEIQDNNQQIKQQESIKMKQHPKVKKYRKVIIKNNYTIEELVREFKDYDKIETKMKNLLMDINAIKLKNKNMRKKIENATSFIQEIDNHKKSIFEFWKYSNKDEVAQLAEGEAEEVNIIKKVKKVFDYEEDLEKFGEKLDTLQRRFLSNEEMNSIYITSTSQLEILNRIKNNRVLPKDIELSLKQIKQEQRNDNESSHEEDFDVFGGLMDTKIREINSKRHRETPKNKYRILEVNKNSKQIGYKLTLERVVESINRALEKVEIDEEIIVYKAVPNGRIRFNDFNLFDLNPKAELQRAFSEFKSKVSLYKITLKKGAKVIGFTNSIFYDNQYKTLPVGMDIDTRILVNTDKLEIEEIDRDIFKMIKFDDEKNDFTSVTIRSVNVINCEQKEDDEDT